MNQTKLQNLTELKQAKVRCWGIWVSHLLCAPVASVVYASKTNYWLPTLVATGVAIVGIPMAVIDLGLTAGIGAPVTSAAMLCGKVTESRTKRGFFMPEEAELAFFNSISDKNDA